MIESRFDLLDDRVKQLVIKCIQKTGNIDFGYSFGEQVKERYIRMPSGHTPYALKMKGDDYDLEWWDRANKQLDDFVLLVVKRRGYIIQSLVDGFKDIEP